MKSLFKPAIAAGLAMIVSIAPAFTAPAVAQVSGTIATIDIPLAVAGASARAAAYQQINNTYSAQLATIQQRNQQRQQLLQTFDTNGDGNVDEAEAAPAQQEGNPTVQQIQAIDAEIQQLQGPIQRARIYAISQIGTEFNASLQQVVSAQNIQFVISPEALIYEPQGANITQQVIDAINARIPTVTAFPPEGWQPSEQAVNLFQQVQQILVFAAVQQQQQAAQQAAGEGGAVPSR